MSLNEILINSLTWLTIFQEEKRRVVSTAHLDLEVTMFRRYLSVFFLLFLITGITSCSGNSTEPETDDAVLLLNVIPQGGATNVNPDTTITVAFSYPMGHGMEMYVALHEGATMGPIVAGRWMWSEDRTTLTFQPDNPLKPGTTYSLHLGGGMTDYEGEHIGFEEHGLHMGGHWVTQQMLGEFGTGMMGGMGSMMGPGWQDHNGSYGMVFSFTTATTIAAI